MLNEYIENEQNKSDILAVLKQARVLYYKRKAENGPACIKQKNGKSNYVTNIDLEVQLFLYKELKKIYPRAKFIAEEDSEYTERYNETDDFFIIDPIDGTTNCIHNYSSCAICVAYITAGSLEFGAVYALETNELFYAFKGEGAYLNGKPIHVSTNDIEHSLVCIGTASYDRELSEVTFLIAKEMFDNAEDIRRNGSAAVDICNVACGRAEVFYEMRLYPWDFAAAMLILTEAGGKISSFSGSAPSFSKVISILATNGYVHNRVLNIINTYWKENKHNLRVEYEK